MTPSDKGPIFYTGDFLHDVAVEAERAVSLHGDFRSLHEAYAVLLEEVDELWDEVRKKSAHRIDLDVYSELVQIAACCVKTAAMLRNE